ncbi:hypothetical protein [Bradyrhizobium sp. NP1]|uniref:hypothetical protein n=1 Tax=Bradyrhizobium sp. NP1 TaxID=3049772 RepID=UPI0025A55642|nr:hypothetical protein [Bradyrhizobium sp. NP1]WJR75079.1 hypothetical protein QOU61_19910 [Bradyrhizobium sp. NP1]
MRVFCAAVIVALVGSPVYAQDKHIPKYGEEEKEKSATEKAGEKAAERAYQRSLGNIPDQGPTDPWGGVRSDAPKASPTSAAKAKKTKTGNVN